MCPRKVGREMMGNAIDVEETGAARGEKWVEAPVQTMNESAAKPRKQERRG